MGVRVRFCVVMCPVKPVRCVLFRMVIFLWCVFHHVGVCRTFHPLRMLLLICLILWTLLPMTTMGLLFPWRNRNLTLSGDIFLLVLAHLCLFVLLLPLSPPG